MKQTKISIILLSYFSNQRLELCFNKLKKCLNSEQIPFELIIIDDGSDDNSYELALELEKRYDEVSAFQLSRNFTSHYSIFAGLSLASGQCAVPIPDDEQMPYDVIVNMYRLWEKGNKIIIPYRVQRDEGITKKFFASLFYRIMNKFSDVKYPIGGADSFLIDREVIDIVNSRINPIRTSIISEILRLGFSPYFLPFNRTLGLNGHSSRWTFSKKLSLAKDTFYSASFFPIKIIYRIGLLFSLLSSFLMLFYIYIKIWGDDEIWGQSVPGWTSIVVILFFFGGLNMLCISIVAEYILRIYDEVKNRPGFIIKNKR